MGLLLLLGPGQRATSQPTSTATPGGVQSVRVEGTKHSIVLPNYNPEMPEANNRKLFLNTCTSCHTARYVAMQPDFPRATWTAEVNKMHKAFGCPVSEDQVEPIVDYLMAIRGAKK